MAPRKTGRAAQPAAPAVSPLPQPSALAFKRRNHDGEIYQLPGSDLPARIRRPGLMAMAVRAGRVPSALSQAIIRHQAVIPTEQMTEEQQIQGYQENAQVYVEIAALALVEPRLVLDGAPDYEAGEIAPSDLSDRDLIFIYNVVQGCDADNALFRVA